MAGWAVGDSRMTVAKRSSIRFATVRKGVGVTAALVRESECFALPFADVGELLRSGRDLHSLGAGEHLHLGSVDTLQFAPLIPEPGKIFCVGLNYRCHLRELALEAPVVPTLFAKFGNALIGAGDAIEMPAFSYQVDWEAELVIVIGKTASRVDGPAAAAVIAGYTVGNDVSVRDLQLRTNQWLAGKTVDRTTPLGPYLVLRDDVDISAEGLQVTCHVNSECVQAGNTRDLLFDPPSLVADISRFCTLQPGDLIFTGTPGGIGAARRPPRFLQAGDVLTTSIEAIGTARNICRPA